MIRVVVRRSELRAAGACAEGRRLFEAIATKGIVKVDWSPLHALWLASVHPQFSEWLIQRRIIPATCLAGANLADAYLARAYLAGANLADAYLAGANLARANLADAYLARANLADAYLAGAYLAGGAEVSS